MKKVLFAINNKQTEAALTERLQQFEIIPTGAVTYREAIAASLSESPADILVFRENLMGSTNVFELMKELRINYSRTRIVFIGNARPVTDKFLGKLACLGIYDIIASDRISLSDMVDFIAHPRDFSHVAKYFQEQVMDDMLPDPPPPPAPAALAPQQKKGLFTGLIDKLAGTEAAPVQAAPTPTPVQATVQVTAPSVDIDTMRGAMLEEARRQAQVEVKQMVETQVNAATAALQSDIDRQNQTIGTLTKSLKEKMASEDSLKKQLDDANLLIENLNPQLQKTHEEADKALQSYQAQLVSLQATKPPDWYEEQTRKWLAEREYLQGKITEKETLRAALEEKLRAVTAEKDTIEAALKAKSEELQNLSMSMPRDITGAVESALDVDFVDIPDEEYKPTPTGEGRVIAFMGTKHGAGNTTVALNTAIALANCGYKTLFIEMNRNFPMVNEFFEFNNIIRGLDTAALALQQNNTKLASQCIIKPHGVRTNKHSLAKVYKRLPGPLHFLLFSNEYLIRSKEGKAAKLGEREIKDLMYYLTIQECYSYVIIDIQPDDQVALDMFISSSYQVNQLVLTMTQDPHSVTTAAHMITKLARSRNGGLVRNAMFVVNQYSSSNKMSLGKIGDFLHVTGNRLSKISLDSKGYMDSAYSATPYMTAKGKYSNEYIDLRMKLTG